MWKCLHWINSAEYYSQPWIWRFRIDPWHQYGLFCTQTPTTSSPCQHTSLSHLSSCLLTYARRHAGTNSYRGLWTPCTILQLHRGVTSSLVTMGQPFQSCCTFQSNHWVSFFTRVWAHRPFLSTLGSYSTEPRLLSRDSQFMPTTCESLAWRRHCWVFRSGLYCTLWFMP